MKVIRSLKNFVYSQLIMAVFCALNVNMAHARPYNYPATRYMNAESQALGGVTLPLADELGNDLFNNPAALARNTKFRAEYLNLGLEANSNVLGTLGLSTPKMMGLGGMTETLNQNPNQVFGGGLSNLTALAWGGLGAGLLIQERVRAASNGTSVDYDTVSQFIPSAGYGVALARGVVRLGYSLQWVNQGSGAAQTTAGSSASFLSGIKQGWGLSHNASVNFIFPFTYLPTLSLSAKNIGGLHYIPGGLFSRVTNATGTPDDESMSLEASLNMMVRLSGTFKTNWYLQATDLTNSAKLPVLERFHIGADFGFNQGITVRAGFTGTEPSAGIGYRSEASEINLAWYHEPVPFTSAHDTRYTLQYKIFFQDKNVRDRDKETKGKPQND